MTKFILFTFLFLSTIVPQTLGQSSVFVASKSTNDQPIIFPNPAVNKIFLDPTCNFISIEMYDLSGNLRLTVKSFDDSFIDVSGLKSSIYLVKIVTTKGVSISKITIRH